jgi:hypothetical protein
MAFYARPATLAATEKRAATSRAPRAGGTGKPFAQAARDSLQTR